MKTRELTLRNGYKLEIEYSDGFYNKLREHYGLAAEDTPSDDDVARYILTECQSTRNMIDDKDKE